MLFLCYLNVVFMFFLCFFMLFLLYSYTFLNINKVFSQRERDFFGKS